MIINKLNLTQKTKNMLKIVDYKEKQSHAGKTFLALVAQGHSEIISHLNVKPQSHTRRILVEIYIL